MSKIKADFIAPFSQPQLKIESPLYAKATPLGDLERVAVLSDIPIVPETGKTNYVTNGIANNTSDVAAWTVYDDSSAIPIDGINGVPTITWNRNIVSPISEIGDFRFVKGSVNSQGEGVSLPITIDKYHRLKVMEISFYYQLVSGTYSTGDLTVYLVDDLGAIITPSQNQISSTGIGNISKFKTIFQLTNQLNYRLCIHVATTSVSPYSFSFNNFKIWEQVVVPSDFQVGTIIEYDFEDYNSTWRPCTAEAISRTTFLSLWTKVSRVVTSINTGTDTINSAGHGLSNDAVVKFGFTGGGITAGQVYYIINSTTDDFQIALTKSGSAINLTADLSGAMIVNVEYGFGNGTTTFNVPDRRAVYLRGAGVHGDSTYKKYDTTDYDGGAIGEKHLDKILTHTHTVLDSYATVGMGVKDVGIFNVVDAVTINDQTRTTSTPSNGRNSDEVAPFSVAVQWIVKVQES